MSKIKRIIEIKERDIQEIIDYRNGEHRGQLRYEIVSNAFKAIAQSKPYNPSDDLISRNAVKDFINEVCFSKDWAKYRADYGSKGQIECILNYIDNAPAIIVSCEDCDGYEAGYSAGLNDTERPQGDLISRSEAMKLIPKVIGGQNEFADCIRDSVKQVIDAALVVEPKDNYYLGYAKGLEDAKSDIIALIANEYTSHGELIPNWLTIGEIRIADRHEKGSSEE